MKEIKFTILIDKYLKISQDIPLIPSIVMSFGLAKLQIHLSIHVQYDHM